MSLQEITTDAKHCFDYNIFSLFYIGVIMWELIFQLAYMLCLLDVHILPSPIGSPVSMTKVIDVDWGGDWEWDYLRYSS